MEKELINKIKKGDSKAFEQLLEEKTNLIKKIVNSQAVEYGDYRIDKDELKQIAEIALFEACQKFDESKGMSFSSFVYMMIRSRMMNYYSSCARVYSSEYYSLNVDRYSLYRNVDNVADVAYNYHVEKELEEALTNYINKLSKEDRKILRMKNKNYTCTQIAQELNTTPKKVLNRIYYLRKKFRKND